MNCLIDVDPDYCYEQLFCKILKAKRQWRCGECSTPIFKGSDHEVFVGRIDDDRIETHRTCMMCVQIRNKFCCNWHYEGLYDDIQNAIEDSFELENCILNMATKDEYNKLVHEMPFLEDEEEDE